MRIFKPKGSNQRGRKLKLHSYRNTFATILTSSNVMPNIAKELMRHSDIRLTLELYADRHLLPVAAEMDKVPSLSASPTASPKAGNCRQSVSNDVHANDLEQTLEPADRDLLRALLSKLGLAWPSPKMAEREGFEPSVTFLLRTLSKGVL